MFEKIIGNEISSKCKHFKIEVIDAETTTDDEENDGTIGENSSTKVKKQPVDITEEYSVDFYVEHIPDEATHGDIIVIGEKSLRSRNVYFVNCQMTGVDGDDDGGKNIKAKKTLVQKESSVCSKSGRCCVPIEISGKIKDPLKFYENAFTFNKYDEIDFEGIEIDTEFHRDLIKQFTNGKEVDFGRKCFYFFSFNDWDLSSGKLTILCLFGNCQKEKKTLVNLKRHLNSNLIGI